MNELPKSEIVEGAEPENSQVINETEAIEEDVKKKAAAKIEEIKKLCTMEGMKIAFAKALNSKNPFQTSVCGTRLKYERMIPVCGVKIANPLSLLMYLLLVIYITVQGIKAFVAVGKPMQSIRSQKNYTPWNKIDGDTFQSWYERDPTKSEDSRYKEAVEFVTWDKQARYVGTPYSSSRAQQEDSIFGGALMFSAVFNPKEEESISCEEFSASLVIVDGDDANEVLLNIPAECIVYQRPDYQEITIEFNMNKQVELFSSKYFEINAYQKWGPSKIQRVEFDLQFLTTNGQNNLDYIEFSLQNLVINQDYSLLTPNEFYNIFPMIQEAKVYNLMNTPNVVLSDVEKEIKIPMRRSSYNMPTFIEGMLNSPAFMSSETLYAWKASIFDRQQKSLLATTTHKIVFEFDLEFEEDVQISYNSFTRMFQDIFILQLASLAGIVMIFYSAFFVFDLKSKYVTQILEKMNLVNSGEKMSEETDLLEPDTNIGNQIKQNHNEIRNQLNHIEQSESSEDALKKHYIEKVEKWEGEGSLVEFIRISEKLRVQSQAINILLRNQNRDGNIESIQIIKGEGPVQNPADLIAND